MVDEAKFGKRKFNKVAYREGVWVLDGVDRETGDCFLAPTARGMLLRSFLSSRTGSFPDLLSTVYTDGWSAYNSLVARDTHTIQATTPYGLSTPRQEFISTRRKGCGTTSSDRLLVVRILKMF